MRTFHAAYAASMGVEAGFSAGQNDVDTYGRIRGYKGGGRRPRKGLKPGPNSLLGAEVRMHEAIKKNPEGNSEKTTLLEKKAES